MKTICKIEEQYTGGGCEHLSVYFPEYNLEFTVMSADEYTNNQIPAEGEKWCFNLSNGGKWIEGDYIETSATLLDFNPKEIASWCEGYIIAKGYKKTAVEPEQRTNPLDEMHQSLNDIYAQYDMGKIEYIEAVEILRRVAEHFLERTK